MVNPFTTLVLTTSEIPAALVAKANAMVLGQYLINDDHAPDTGFFHCYLSFRVRQWVAGGCNCMVACVEPESLEALVTRVENAKLGVLRVDNNTVIVGPEKQSFFDRLFS